MHRARNEHTHHHEGATMKSLGMLLLSACLMFLTTTGLSFDKNKFVGVKQCKACHTTEKQGKQFVIWQQSKHSGAFKTLTTAKADEVAKGKGLKTKAAESPECL